MITVWITFCILNQPFFGKLNINSSQSDLAANPTIFQAPKRGIFMACSKGLGELGSSKSLDLMGFFDKKHPHDQQPPNGGETAPTESATTTGEKKSTKGPPHGWPLLRCVLKRFPWGQHLQWPGCGGNEPFLLGGGMRTWWPDAKIELQSPWNGTRLRRFLLRHLQCDKEFCALWFLT